MPGYTVVIILAVAGALCLALTAAGVRRLPGGWRWTELQQEQDPKVARRAVLLILSERFGDLPPAVVTRIESESPEWCEDIITRAIAAKSLEDLGL